MNKRHFADSYKSSIDFKRTHANTYTHILILNTQQVEHFLGVNSHQRLSKSIAADMKEAIRTYFLEVAYLSIVIYLIREIRCGSFKSHSSESFLDVSSFISVCMSSGFSVVKQLDIDESFIRIRFKFRAL